MKKKGEQFYNQFKDHEQVFKNDKYHMFVTVVKPFKWKQLMITDFKDAEDFGDATVATG